MIHLKNVIVYNHNFTNIDLFLICDGSYNSVLHNYELLLSYLRKVSQNYMQFSFASCFVSLLVHINRFIRCFDLVVYIRGKVYFSQFLSNILYFK